MFHVFIDEEYGDAICCLWPLSDLHLWLNIGTVHLVGVAGFSSEGETSIDRIDCASFFIRSSWVCGRQSPLISSVKVLRSFYFEVHETFDVL